MSDILLIHQHPEHLGVLSTVLLDQGITVELACTVPGEEALSAYDCVVAIDNMVDDTLSQVARCAPCIVLSESPTIAGAVLAMRRGAVDYLQADSEPDALVAAIERATAHAVVARQTTLDQFPMIGSSEPMQTLKSSIAKAAPTRSTVLILGQSGTGKELVARALHASSERANAPLISINCATVPQNLIESELFGLEHYDNNSQPSRGLIEAAEGGTLFLDEIAELPSSAQARLLRVLQGENRPVGSSMANPADVRIIAATHRNLGQLAESGDFRADLYYRLNVITFEIPPLHQRKEDVLEIGQWLLERTSARLNKEGLIFAEEAIDAMRRYHWPGNVRELENAIERAVILADSHSPITQKLLAIEPPPRSVNPPEMAADSDQTSLEDYFVRFVLDNQDQLTETELAEKLGISRKSLWERRQRLNIPRRKTRKRGPRRDS